MAGPLRGIKVLDLSLILAGPWSTQLLSNLADRGRPARRSRSGIA